MSKAIGLDKTPATPQFSHLIARVRNGLTALAFRERVLPLAIVLAVVAVFAVALRNEFVEWDDYTNLVENRHYRGLGLPQLAWMFTTTLTGHYIPLTWATFGLDYLVWGMQPAGYHFTNLVLHAANAALLYWIAKRLLTAAQPRANEAALRAGAAVAALFFAVHPLRVESVVWATERRDVLSGLLFLICVLTYLKAASASGSQRRWLLAGSIIAFALSILAKAIVMTLPLLLILIDWYPLRRLQWPLQSPQRRSVLMEKLPFLALGIVAAAVSYWALLQNTHIRPTMNYPLPSRVAMALYSMTFYISKTILPVDLSPLYELPSHVSPLDPRFLGAAGMALSIAVALAMLARRWPAGLAVYAWYAIMLAPVGGLVKHGFQLAHDRYSYLSCLSFAVLVGAGVTWLVVEHARAVLRPSFFRASCATVGILLVTLAVLTWLQVQVWHDTESLWSHATYATPDCSICHNNYGVQLLRANRSPFLAIEHFQQALVLKPDDEKPYRGLGMALVQIGRPREAEAALRRAVVATSPDVGPLNNLGLALIQQRRFAEALPYLRRAVAMDHGNVVARANLGQALVGVGRIDEAVTELRGATEEQPFELAPRIALILAYREARNDAELHKQLIILSQLHPLVARQLPANH